MSGRLSSGKDTIGKIIQYLSWKEGVDSNSSWEEYEQSSNVHESESALDDWDFDYTIDNNKDIPHLVTEVKKMLKHFEIL